MSKKTLHEIFVDLAKKYDKSPAQIILKWHTQMQNIVIPGARSEEHIKQNIDLFDFELTQEEMQEIAKLDKNTRYYYGTEANIKQYAMWQPTYENK